MRIAWRFLNSPDREFSFGARHMEKFDTLSAEDEWHGAYKAAWASVWQGGMPVLLGNRGTGKTQIACELARSMSFLLSFAIAFNERHSGSASPAVMKSYKGQAPSYCLAADIGMHVRESYQKKEGGGAASTKKALERFQHPILLVIDEVQEQLESTHDRQMLTRVIDSRYANELPTVLIGNCTPDSLLGFVGASVYDRCYDGGCLIECNWQSFRRRT